MRGTVDVKARLGMLVGICLCLGLACQPAQTADPRTDQVIWGESVYAWHCARCHEPDRSVQALEGRFLVPGYPDAQALFDFISAAMPFDAPGSLPEDDYWAVTAFILHREGLLALPSRERLGPDTAGEVSLGAELPEDAADVAQDEEADDDTE